MLIKCCVALRAGVGLQLLWCCSVLLYLSAAAAEWYMLLLSFPAVGSISCHHSPRTTAANYFSTGPRYYSKAAARCVFSRAILGICVLWYQRVGSCFYPFYPPLHPCAAGWECWVTAHVSPCLFWSRLSDYFLSLPLLKSLSFSWFGANVLSSICAAWC